MSASEKYECMTGVLASPLLSRLPWIEHGFGTRRASLTQESMVSLKQIHSNLSLVADRPKGCVGEGDALVTNQSGVTLSIRTADCFPILLADTRTRVIAAVHAGWRGTADRIVVETLEQMRRDFGVKAEDVYAAIGPGIGACCYEVSEDVARRFGEPGSQARDNQVRDNQVRDNQVRDNQVRDNQARDNQAGKNQAGKIMLDLARINRQQLVQTGVPEAHIETVAGCTFCEAGRFYSYRREKENAGRMISYIAVAWSGDPALRTVRIH